MGKKKSDNKLEERRKRLALAGEIRTTLKVVVAFSLFFWNLIVYTNIFYAFGVAIAGTIIVSILSNRVLKPILLKGC